MLIVHSKDKLCARVARIKDNIHWAWKNKEIFHNYEKKKTFLKNKTKKPPKNVRPKTDFKPPMPKLLQKKQEFQKQIQDLSIHV